MDDQSPSSKSLEDEIHEELRKPRYGKDVIEIGFVTIEENKRAPRLTGRVNNIVPVHSYCAGERGFIEEGYVVALNNGTILRGHARSNSQFEIAEHIAALRYLQQQGHEIVFYLDASGEVFGFSQRLQPPPGLQEREEARGWRKSDRS